MFASASPPYKRVPNILRIITVKLKNYHDKLSPTRINLTTLFIIYTKNGLFTTDNASTGSFKN